MHKYRYLVLFNSKNVLTAVYIFVFLIGKQLGRLFGTDYFRYVWCWIELYFMGFQGAVHTAGYRAVLIEI